MNILSSIELTKQILLNEVGDKLPQENKEVILSTINKSLTVLEEEAKEMILDKKEVTKVFSTNKYYWCQIRKTFIDKITKEEMHLTNLESKFIQLLIHSKDIELVDYDTIKNVVWHGKDMSIYTMRNIINKIRVKLGREFIKNHSNKGYSLGEV